MGTGVSFAEGVVNAIDVIKSHPISGDVLHRPEYMVRYRFRTSGHDGFFSVSKPWPRSFSLTRLWISYIHFPAVSGLQNSSFDKG